MANLTLNPHCGACRISNPSPYASQAFSYDLDWRTLPSLSSLRAFDAAARSGSFSAAARRLNVTHAAVAQQVRALEADLGVPLLVRAGRGVQPTRAGRQLVEATAAAFGQLAQGVDRARTTAGRQIRVTTTSYTADAVILPRIGEFWADNPGVELAFTPTEVTVDLVADGFDVVVRAGAVPVPGCDLTPLCDSRWMAATSPDVARDAAAVAALPWIGAGTEWERRMLDSAGIDPDAVRWLDVGDPRLEMTLAERGLGKLLATEIVAAPGLASGRLVEVPTPIDGTTHYAALTLTGERRPAVKAFVAWLQKLFADPGGQQV